jgi:hypothetical protein
MGKIVIPREERGGKERREREEEERPHDGSG